MCGFLVVENGKKSNEKINSSFEKIHHRGPDESHIVEFPKGIFAFHRLAIMDLSHSGMQPFETESKNLLVCNGEIYNYKDLKQKTGNYQYHSHSDCEVLLPLYEKYGISELVNMLDGEYAFVLWDQKKQKFIAARDPMGIRPLFYGKCSQGFWHFSSEVKAIHDLCVEVAPFPPGHYFDGSQFICFHDYGKISKNSHLTMEQILSGINAKLKSGVHKRLQSDAQIGFLLSGGLDSSLVCAIAQRYSSTPIKTFSVGMPHDAIDAKYAQDVANFIGSHHTNVTMTIEDVLAALKTVIYHLETWDITTVRASIGMYLVCKYIRKHTPIKVLLTGEVSDELFGYKYTDFAPNDVEFQNEAIKRIRELYIYDVLRADRCIAGNSLEARVPFSDQEFVDFVMSIDPKFKMNTTGTGKYLLRKAFEFDKLLPEHILWREKAAFSDAVGHSMVDELKKYAAEHISDEEFHQAKTKFPYCSPISKESYLYRKVFEEFYPNRSKLIKDYWLPNKNWENCNVQDPSARILPNYGKSGV
jgi:asparagine synthase (glutamine-hydrolysing)